MTGYLKIWKVLCECANIMIPPRVSFPFVVFTTVILFQVIQGKNSVIREPIYECISNRELANIPFRPEHIGNFQTLYDHDREIIAHRNRDKRLCFIQKTNPSMAKVKSRCLNSFQMKYIAGSLIDNFCRGYKPLLVGSATPLHNSVTNDSQMTNESFEKNVAEYTRVRRNAGQIPNTQNATPLRGRYRGQTQSQYLNFNGESTPPGRAEAESTPTGSRAVVSGKSGMGQAQSQSGFSSGCEDCYGQSPHLTGGRYSPHQDSKVVSGSPKHYLDTESVGSRYGIDDLSKTVSGYPPSAGTQSSGNYPDGSKIGTYTGQRGDQRQDKYSQRPDLSSGPGQIVGYGDRTMYQPTSERDTFRQVSPTDSDRSPQRQPLDSLGRPNISGKIPAGSQEQPLGAPVQNRPFIEDRGSYIRPTQEFTKIRQNGYPTYHTEGRFQPTTSDLPGNQDVSISQKIPGTVQSTDGRYLQPGATQALPGSSFQRTPVTYLPDTTRSYPTGGQNGYNQNLQPNYPEAPSGPYDKNIFGTGGPQTQPGTSVQVPPNYYQTLPYTYQPLPDTDQRKLQGVQSHYPGLYQQPQSTHQRIPGSYQEPESSYQRIPGSHQEQQRIPGSYQEPQSSQQIPGLYQGSAGQYQIPQESYQNIPGSYQRTPSSQQSPVAYPGPPSSQQSPVAYPGPPSSQQSPVTYPGPPSSQQIPVTYPGPPSSQQSPVTYPGPPNTYQIPSTYQGPPDSKQIQYYSSLPGNYQTTSNGRQGELQPQVPFSTQQIIHGSRVYPDPNQSAYEGTPAQQKPQETHQHIPTQSMIPGTHQVPTTYQRIPGTQQITQGSYQDGSKDSSVLQHPYQVVPGFQTQGPQLGAGTNNFGAQPRGQENGNIPQGHYQPTGIQQPTHGVQPNQVISHQAVPGTIIGENQGVIPSQTISQSHQGITGLGQDSYGGYPATGSQVVHQGPNIYQDTLQRGPGTYPIAETSNEQRPYGTITRPGAEQYVNERPTHYISPSDLYNSRNQGTQGTGYVQGPPIKQSGSYRGVYPPSQSHISHQWDGHTPGTVDKYSTHEHQGVQTVPANVKDEEEEDANSQAETSIKQLENGTFASSSSTGVYGGGSAQTQISGSYSGSGSFSAQAQTIEANRGSQSQVTAGGEGITSSAQGRGGRGQSQVQMQMGKEMGETIANAQSTGINHGTNTQVQASSKGGLADAQASGPGSTSSQAQIGFQPQETEYESHNGEGPFYGGGTASAQSGKYDGQSQTQIQGRFKYGISYTGAAQAGSGLKDGGGSNRTVLKPLNLFGNGSPRLDRDAEIKSAVVNTTEESPKEVFEESESNLYDNIQYPAKKENKIQNPVSKKPNNEYKASQKYSMNQKHSSSIKGDLSDNYSKGIKDIPNVEDYDENDSEEEDYDSEFYQSTEMNLNQPREVVVQQTGGNQKQHVILVSTNNNGIHIVKDSSSKDLLQEGMVFQPGEEIPGSQGYTIPIGFRGRITSVSGSDDTYAYADENGESQAQTITMIPGKPNITLEESAHKNQRGVKSWPSRNSGHNYKVNSNNLRSNYKVDNPDYVTVTKSIAGELNEDKTGLLEDKKISHTYYTKSSTCGYFTFTCSFVDGSNGRKKLCRPKTPTNPDGTPIKC